jgi:signal transduction histidine kinase
LHPARLERDGLVAALRAMCREWAGRYLLEATFVHTDPPQPVPPAAAALCLYRVAQEALRNVARHSGARRTLGTSAGEVRLTVADDGAGIDPSASHGLGLVVMRERLDLAGGRLTMASSPGSGTTVTAAIPAPGGERGR